MATKQAVFFVMLPTESRNGIGWRSNGSTIYRSLAMGVVKPANDEAEFYQGVYERNQARAAGD